VRKGKKRFQNTSLPLVVEGEGGEERGGEKARGVPFPP